MTSYIKFIEANVLVGQLVEGHYVNAAIDLTSADVCVLSGVGAALECKPDRPVLGEEVNILEIAFHGGKQRSTTFDVEVVESTDDKKFIGTFESRYTTNFQKFRFPEPVSDIKAVILTFRENDDGSHYFMIKGLRLARELTDKDKRKMSIKL